MTFWNAFWLILPALAWNAAFASRLTGPGFTDDSSVPTALLWTENVLRLPVFLGPLLLPLVFPLSAKALATVGFGYALYFLSWLPHLLAPQSVLAQHPAIILGPALTPLVIFLGIATMTDSRLYAIASLAFITVHVAHQLYSFQLL